MSRPRRKAARTDGTPALKQWAGHPRPHQLVCEPARTKLKRFGAHSIHRCELEREKEGTSFLKDQLGVSLLKFAHTNCQETCHLPLVPQVVASPPGTALVLDVTTIQAQGSQGLHGSILRTGCTNTKHKYHHSGTTIYTLYVLITLNLLQNKGFHARPFWTCTLGINVESSTHSTGNWCSKVPEAPPEAPRSRL